MSADATTEETSLSGLRERARALIHATALGAEAFGRPDLVAIQERALARVDRAETLVAVVGEFKQGKSSLVNALLGVDVAPVDDDIATARPTVFRFSRDWGATVVRRVDGERTARPVSIAESRAFVTEQQSNGAGGEVELVEARLPARRLEAGLVLVDTPGFGGLGAGSGEFTPSFLGAVDAVVFASDATAPLAAGEMEFLRKAAEACPAVLVALTKTDLGVEWRQVMELDAEALAAAGLDVPIIPVSSVVMAAASSRDDASLAEMSGVPALAELLDSMAGEPARAEACRRGIADSELTLQHLSAAAADELAALESPEKAAERQRALDDLVARLDHLRGPGARWSQLLADRFADVGGDADYRYREALRTILREFDERMEKVDPASGWEELSASIREQVAAATGRLFADIEGGARDAERTIREALRSEEGVELTRAAASGVNIEAAANLVSKAISRPGFKGQAETLLSGARGGQGGMLMLGLFAGLAGVAVSTMATAGVGLIFGGRQILEERKRQVQARRQQARSLGRQYVDDVQFQASKHARDLARDLQRDLRDGFLERFGELQRTCTASIAAMQDALKREGSGRRARAEVVRERLAQFQALDHALREAGEQL